MGLVVFLLLFVLFAWTLCAAAGKHREYEDQLYEEWLRERNRKD